MVVERGMILGRSQEWNIALNELQALIRVGILNDEDLEAIIGIKFNPNRIGFKTDTSGTENKGYEVYVKNILNLGVKPDVLIEMVKNR